MPSANEQPPANGVQSHRQTRPSFYRSAAGEAELSALYDRMLASLTFKHEESLVRRIELPSVRGYVALSKVPCAAVPNTHEL